MQDKPQLKLSIAKHAREHGIIPLKRYGQNFLFDSTLCDKIVNASGLSKGDLALEIGPGVGGLTRSILSVEPKELTIVEADMRCMPLLEDIGAAYPNLKIVLGDAMRFELSQLCADRALRKQLSEEVEQPKNSHAKIHIISNLPYNIGTELVIRWLKQAHLIKNMTLMLQREVVDRICASTNSKSYGRLSIICQLLCSTEKCFEIGPEAFYPPPKVRSAIVKLTPLAELLPNDIINTVELLTRLAFGNRRKMLKSSLKQLETTIHLEELLSKAQIDPTARAETLSPQDYLRLAYLVANLDKPL